MGSPCLLLSLYHDFSAYRGSLSWFLWPKEWHDFCQHFACGWAWLPNWDLFLEHDLEKHTPPQIIIFFYFPPQSTCFCSRFQALR